MRPIAASLALLLSILVTAASLGGLLLPGAYARETPSWAAQAVGQDVFDLAVLVPVLVLSAVATLRGSARAGIVLGGALAYTTYTFVLYAFAVHFNALFLVYCATLGISVFALASLAADARPSFDERTPVASTGAFLVALAVVFAAMWLAEIVPALASRSSPRSVAENGMFTNPVHALDLSIVLPAMVVAGLALRRRRPVGYLLAPILLTFSALMAATIAVLSLAGDKFVALLFTAFAVVVVAVLVRFLRHLRGSRA